MNAAPWPRFGEKVDKIDYIVREGVYAVIVDDKRVAAIRGSSGYFLPGGGAEGNEEAEETLIREFAEECNASIELLSLIGRATDFLFSSSEHCHFEKRGTFYLARFLSEPDEHVLWIPFQDAPGLFRQRGHVWAIQQGIERSGSKEDLH